MLIRIKNNEQKHNKQEDGIIMKRNIFVVAMIFYSSLVFGTRERDKDYYKACREIDQMHAGEAKNRFMRVRTNGTIEDDLRALKREIEAHAQCIDKVREEIIQGFKKYAKKYVNDGQWDDCMERLYEIQKSNKNFSNKSLNAFGHIDKNFPKDACGKIKKELIKQNAVLNGIRLLESPDGNFSYGVVTRVSGNSGKYLIINTNAWREFDEDMKDFVCVSMVGELNEKLSLFVQLIGLFWPAVINKPELRDEIAYMQNKARVFGIFSVCIKSAEGASLIKKYALHTTTYVSPNDYRLISAVEWRWRNYKSLVNCYVTQHKVPPRVCFTQPHNSFDEADED
jgi:hypothetical protein